MNLTYWPSQALCLPFKNFGLVTFVVGMFLLAVLLAEGCVKRPDLEPTPGVSSQDLNSMGAVMIAGIIYKQGP